MQKDEQTPFAGGMNLAPQNLLSIGILISQIQFKMG